MAHLSVVVPVFREEALLRELCSRLTRNLESITPDHEIILVEDGGGDRSWEIIQEHSSGDPRIKGIKFSRNFGQHYAISAGLDASDGNWVVVMDGDLQDRPEVIPDLYAKAQEGWDVVFVVREDRPESAIYRFFQRCFYALFQYMARTTYDPAHGNFSIISRSVVDYYRRLEESLRFYGGIVNWLGFRQTSIRSRHGERFAGETKYTLVKRFVLAGHMILAHSDRPLRFSIGLGLGMSILSFGYGIYIVARAIFVAEYSVEGWASLIASIFFTGGVILVVLGIIGSYVGKIFSEIKHRPLYVVADRVGFGSRHERRAA